MEYGEQPDKHIIFVCLLPVARLTRFFSANPNGFFYGAIHMLFQQPPVSGFNLIIFKQMFFFGISFISCAFFFSEAS